MKISLQCKDLILQKALELFLKEHLVMKKDCDFIISDAKIPTQKPLFIISNNSPFLSVPFSKERLLACLNEFDLTLKATAQKLNDEKRKILEQKIDAITQEFKKHCQDKIDLVLTQFKDELIKILVHELSNRT